MAERETTVGAAEGLHARPMKDLVDAAKRYSSRIVLVKGGKEANAKSPIKLLSLGAKKGDTIVIRAEGEDAEEAVDALVELISGNER